MNAPQFETKKEARFNGNARASIVNRAHRVVRAEAMVLREQREKKRGLWIPLMLFSSLMVAMCYAVWNTLDSYDLVTNGMPEAREQMMLFLLWFVPVTALVVGLVWFKRVRGRSNNGEVQQ